MPPLEHNRSKFQPRASPTAFDPQGMKAYKLYNIDQHKFFTSRDDIFHKDIFPFKNSHTPQHMEDPLPDFSLPKAFYDPLNIPSNTSHLPLPITTSHENILEAIIQPTSTFTNPTVHT